MSDIVTLSKNDLLDSIGEYASKGYSLEEIKIFIYDDFDVLIDINQKEIVSKYIKNISKFKKAMHQILVKKALGDEDLKALSMLESKIKGDSYYG